MKYYLIAGEASGDMHAANCMSELIKRDPSAQFAFTGGDQMEAVSGKKACIHIKQMAFMGFAEVLMNIGAIRRNFATVKKDILEFKPDVLLLIDYPGFNLRMAKWATERGIKTDYYISPTVWAWKENRVEKVRKYTHKMFVILPFEEAFYNKLGIKVHFVGHPLIDAIEKKLPALTSKEQFISENGLSGKPLVAVLPGSRVQEIERMLEMMTSVFPMFPDYEFVIAGSNTLDERYYEELKKRNIKVVFNQTYELMRYAVAGVIKSGTSTLESALMKLPQVVCYRTGAISYAIGKKLIKLKFISLPNLILDKPVVKELIQDDFTAANIAKELNKLLNDTSYRLDMLSDYESVRSKLGGAGASARIAEALEKDARGTKN